MLHFSYHLEPWSQQRWWPHPFLFAWNSSYQGSLWTTRYADIVRWRKSFKEWPDGHSWQFPFTVPKHPLVSIAARREGCQILRYACTAHGSLLHVVPFLFCVAHCWYAHGKEYENVAPKLIHINLTTATSWWCTAPNYRQLERAEETIARHQALSVNNFCDILLRLDRSSTDWHMYTVPGIPYLESWSRFEDEEITQWPFWRYSGFQSYST